MRFLPPVVLVAVGVALSNLCGCDGQVGSDGIAGTGGTGGTGGFGAFAGTAGTGFDGGLFDAPIDAPADIADAFEEYVDPGCPDAGAPQTDYECDPYHSEETCGFEASCTPYVDYPTEPCGQEVYGSTCSAAGTGGQGEGCDSGCLPDYTCVVTGQGIQCVKLCKVSDPSTCSNGLVCEAIDIPGFGGCL